MDGPSKRARTDAQMAQKRRMDRLKHQSNRAESKQRMENIESDVLFLRKTVEELVAQLRSRDRDSDSSRSSSLETATQSSPSAGGLRAPNPNMFDSSGTPDSAGSLSTALFHERHSDEASPLPSGASSLLPMVDCRCGIQHNDRSECLEFSSFTILYQSHIALSQNQQQAMRIPRSPSLSNLLLHSINDNPLTMILGSNIRQFKVGNTVAAFGLYFLAYRLLRWRLYPSEDSLGDVPEFMRPTDVQNSYPHPVCIDFMPWHRLRNYLCMNQNKDSRHSVDLYMRSIHLHWPADKELLCRSSVGDFVVNPDFEAIASDLGNWQLKAPFTETFPHLMQYVHA